MMYDSDHQEQQMADPHLLNELPLNQIDRHKSSHKTDNSMY